MRPPLEVADIFRQTGTTLDSHARCRQSSVESCAPSSVVGPQPWADILSSAIRAAINVSHITRVAIAIAPSVSRWRKRVGSKRASRICCPGACKQAMISALRFHDLRHTFATRLRAKGVHEMDIMTLLGHTTLQMTSRYTHAMPENLRTAVDSLNNRPLPFRPSCAPRSRQLATGTDGN